MKVIIATEQKHFAAAFRIRTNVFVGEQKVPACEEIDELDCHVPIFVVYDEQNNALGTARVIVVNEEIAKVGRVAVDLNHRKKGVGKALMEGVHDYIREKTLATKVKLSAQVSAIPFYESLGYQAYGEKYLDGGIDHRDMTKILVE